MVNLDMVVDVLDVIILGRPWVGSYPGSYLYWFRDPPAPGGPAGDFSRIRRRRRHRRRIRRVLLLGAGAVARRPVERGRDLFTRLRRAPETQVDTNLNLNFPPLCPHYRVTHQVGKWVGLTLIWDVPPSCLGSR